MKLSQLLAPWVSNLITDCEIINLENDSRRIQKGDLFFAYPGAHVDGRQFIEAVIEKGAAAIVYEAENAKTLPTNTIPMIPLDQVFKRMGEIAARFYDEPSQKMKVIGITGTNGKTTIAYQLAQAYCLLGSPAAYIGTIGFGHPDQLKLLPNTTPDGLCLQKILFGFANAGIQQVCMEVSSHALAEERVNGVHFSQAIFTNLTRDHLDFHHTMEAYGEAKARLFAKKELEVVILNADDPATPAMQQVIQAPTVQLWTYGIQHGEAIRADDIHMTQRGIRFTLRSAQRSLPCEINAIGAFNLSNALAIVSSLLASGYTLDKIQPILPRLKAAPGRMEIVTTEPVVIVDFAHTPDALQNVLENLRDMVTGRLIVVFGCGGERDAGKRPLMGKVASELADVLILTNDNPRNEDPVEILQAIQTGISPKIEVEVIPDRHAAIERAIRLAQSEDVVLIAGKGHEMYQQIGEVKHYFSDQEVVREYETTICKHGAKSEPRA